MKYIIIIMLPCSHVIMIVVEWTVLVSHGLQSVRYTF